MGTFAIGLISGGVFVATVATLFCILLYHVGVYDGKHGTKFGKEDMADYLKGESND